MEHMLDTIQDSLDKYMVTDLVRHYSYAIKDSIVPMYSFDPLEERKRRKKLAKALKLVIKYYGGDINAKDV